MAIKFKEVFNPTKNSRTKQEGGTWRKNKLKKFGLTPEELMDLIYIRPKVKFYKKNVKK